MSSQTYFRGAALAGLFLSIANPILAQSGSVNFANDSTCQVIDGQTMSPATTGTSALYWAPTNSSSFVQIGASTPIGNPVAGYLAGGTRYTPVAGGVPGQFQVRAWMGAYATYEQAIAVPGALVGSSVIVTFTTGNPAGDPPTPPASLMTGGLVSFTLGPSVNPPLTLTSASNKTVACWGWDFDAPTTSGGCGPIIVTVISNSISGGCPQLFTRTWQATDGCATQTCSQTVTLLDTIPPLISCASNKIVECGLPWTFDAPDARDECNLTSVIVLHTTTNGGCGNTLVATRTWLAADACGNSNQCAQTVTVTSANLPALACASNKFVACTNEWSFDQPYALDACGGTNVSIEVIGTLTNSLCPLSLTRTWRATNGCNPEGVTCSQTVTVLCPGCPVLQLTKSCPIYPVPPGGTLVWTGTITNTADITVSNIVVSSDQPSPGTVVFGPVTLAPGEGAGFGGSHPVPGLSGPHVGTLTAMGTGPSDLIFMGTATASCAGTNHVTPGDMNGDGVVSQAELNAVLANYWPHSSWLTMTNAALVRDGRFQFELTNAGAWNFTVLVSTNATDWISLPAPAFPVYQFIDPEGTNAPQRLYRLQWP